jgi:hypothetical protein
MRSRIPDQRFARLLALAALATAGETAKVAASQAFALRQQK